MFRFNTLTAHLLMINVLVWIATALVLPRLGLDFDWYNYFALHYWQSSDFHIAQFITYMFLHSNHDPMHLFFNMWTLVVFGQMLEMYLGQKRFLTYYIVCGIGAAIVQELVWTYQFYPKFHEMKMLLEAGRQINLNSGEMYIDNIQQLKSVFNGIATVGASGAVFGLLLAFGMFFPNHELFLLFIPMPIKAKYMVVGYAVIELFFGVQGFSGDNIAHFAHLGGMLFGIILILYWKKKGDFNSFM